MVRRFEIENVVDVKWAVEVGVKQGVKGCLCDGLRRCCSRKWCGDIDVGLSCL